MIPLMKYAFYNELETKKELTKFILKADILSMGEQCAKFEKEFAGFQGTKDAVLFNSGSSANLAMIQTFKNLNKLRKGNKIGFSPLTWSTNLMPIIQLELEPVPIDCEPTSLNVMAYQLKERLRDIDIQALFITNALGFAGDLDKIKEICNERNIILFEDNCESLGTELSQGKTGNFGVMSSFSFYVAHHLSTIEGGMVCTNDEELAEMLRIVRAHGWDRNLTTIQQKKWRKKYNITSEFIAKYTFYDLGYNLRPTEITGFLGLYQLQYLENIINAREKNYTILESYVQENPELITLDHSHILILSNFAFPVLCKDQNIREKYLNKFTDSDIEVRPMIAGNIQRQPFYKKYISNSFDLSGTDKIHNCGFYCGNYPELSNTEIQAIAKCLCK